MLDDSLKGGDGIQGYLAQKKVLFLGCPFPSRYGRI